MNGRELNAERCVMVAGEKQYKFEEILPIYKAVSGETDTGI